MMDTYAVEAETNRLLRNRMGGSGAARGGASLGALLAGGGKQQQQDYFNRGALQGSTIAERMASTRKIQSEYLAQESKRIAREGLKQNLIDNHVDPNQASIIASVLGAGYNPSQVIQYQTGATKLPFLAQSLGDAMTGADNNQMNRLSSALSGKPLEQVRNEGGVNVQPFATPDSQTIAPNALGNASIAERMAAAGAHNAAAGHSSALARMVGMRMAGTLPAAAGRPGAPLKPTPLTTLDAQTVLGDGGSPDADKVRQFLKFQSNIGQSDPNALNTSYALQKYAGALGFDPDEQPPGTIPMTDATPAAAAPAAPGLVSRAATGLTSLLGGNSAPPAVAPAKIGGSPYPEGMHLKGHDGKMYVVQGGQPVPM